METLTTQGSRLKEIREVLRLSQVEFANHLGIAGPSIAKAEKDVNKLSNDTLVKLSEKFSVDLNWLMRGIGSMFIKENAANHSDEFQTRIRLEVNTILDELGLKDIIK